MTSGIPFYIDAHHAWQKHSLVVDDDMPKIVMIQVQASESAIVSQS